MSAANIPGAPDNCIQIVTPGRAYLVVPVSDDDVDTWVGALQKAIDIYGSENPDAVEAAEPETAMKFAEFIMHGELERQSIVLGVTRQWTAQYFTLSKTRLDCFAKKSDVFDEDEDPVESLQVNVIMDVRSLDINAANSNNVGFKLSTHSTTWIVRASTTDRMKLWLMRICKATKKLQLRQRKGHQGLSSSLRTW